MNKPKTFILKALITAVIYSALLLPFQLNLPILVGTDIRPSAFLPIVFGIFWGMPAAVGIFVGNLFCDLICIDSPLILLGSFLNALSAICARRFFYASWNHGVTSGAYIYSFGSLVNFLITVLSVELALCLPISLTVHFTSGSPILPTFQLIFLNNIHSNVVFGIPVMLFLPAIGRWADEPSGDGGIGRNVLALAFLVSSILFVLPFHFFDLHPAWSVLTIIPLLGAAVSARPAPLLQRDKTLFGLQSIRFTTFRKLMCVSLVVSAVVSGVLIFFILSREAGTDYNTLELFTKIYHLCAYLDIVFLLLFSYSYSVVEKGLLVPIRKLASKLSLDGVDYQDELDILNKRLDFVASENSSLLSGDEHSIIVGLSAKDHSKTFRIPEARDIINSICLKHAGGYLSADAGEGGYSGEDFTGSEQILIYSIFGATDAQIRAIADDILVSLNQESVLIEKNRMIRYYYCGEKKQ